MTHRPTLDHLSSSLLPPHGAAMPIVKTTLRLGICSLTALFTIGALGAEPHHFTPRVWLTPGMYSYHFNRDKGLRDANPGLGIEVGFAPNQAVMAGTYINSNNARSRYIGWAWRPLRRRFVGLQIEAGAAVALIDGYPFYKDGGWFAAPLPLVSIEGRRFGVNLSLIPTLRNRVDGALSFQFKLRLN